LIAGLASGLLATGVLLVSDFRRWFVAGGTYFFTIVTYRRRSLLTDESCRRWLRKSILEVHRMYPFKIIATVLLPDHWHLLLQLPLGDDRYSKRIQRIKSGFTRRALAGGVREASVTQSQARRGERGIWQPRFWEHTVADENDLALCADYIHWNPRKHGLVSRVCDWPWSSFHRFVSAGHYELDWGGTAPRCVASRDTWGEPQ
jgi:putative transposase